MKKNSLPQLKKMYGLSLPELMVAMVVSAILMLGISEIFTINSRTYKVQDESSRMQESGRYAFNTLMQDIRRAGYFGGNAAVASITGSIGISTPPGRNCLTTDTTWGRMLERAIYGLDDGNTNIDANGAAVDYTGCIPDSDYTRGDILVTRFTYSPNIPDATLNLAANANRLYIRNSLFEGRLFKGANNAVAVSNGVTEFPNATQELAAHAYYVGPSGRNCRFNAADNSVIPVPALHREVLNNAGIPVQEEVASGIENIQFQYGIDNNGDLSVNNYYNANEIGNDDTITPNWTQVVTVRFWVLVRAECPTNGYSSTKTYPMGDITYDPADKSFKRQLYSTTVTVRN